MITLSQNEEHARTLVHSRIVADPLVRAILAFRPWRVEPTTSFDVWTCQVQRRPGQWASLFEVTL